MNSAGRRKWRRAHVKDIQKLNAWINAPDSYVSSGRCRDDGTVIMEREQMAAFGRGLQTKAYWKDFLRRRNVYFADDTAIAPTTS
ncbi:MAG: hypothetical protein HYS44_01750 [Candidatus Niyogibacteria bacterium]|nr:hypothetical protein [Candidatus Niyogibacteria bacterium]